MFIKFTNVDSQTGVSIQHASAENGPHMPDLAGLKFGFALESRYPVAADDYPIYYGTCDDNVNAHAEGILAVIDKATYDADFAKEMSARLAKVQTEVYDQIAAKRYQIESTGIQINQLNGTNLPTPITVQTGVADQARISIALTECERFNITSVKFKCANNTWVEMAYENLKTIGGYVANRVQACFAAECKHATNVAALTTVEAVRSYDFSTGWPT